MIDLTKNESFYYAGEEQFQGVWDVYIPKVTDDGVHYLELTFGNEVVHMDIWKCVNAAKEKGYIPIVDWQTGNECQNHMGLINDLRREGCVISGECGVGEYIYDDLMKAEKLDWITDVDPGKDKDQYQRLCEAYGKAYIDQICIENPRRLANGEKVLRV